MSNFVIFSTPEDYYRIIYSDVIGRDNVKYVVSPVENKSSCIRFIYKLLMSPKLAFLFRRFRKYLSPLYDRKFGNNERTVYLFFYGRLPWIEYGLLDYLKAKHPDCLTVCYFQDLISKKDVNINQVKSQFDLVISYDKREAEKYSLPYEPTPFSLIPIEQGNNIVSDVYFIGLAKERLPEIHRLFDILTSNGYICDFYIGGVPKESQRTEKGLHYIEKSISYLENLEKVKSSRIVLELMQTDAVGDTLRTWEAIAYSKILLTNNAYLEGTSLEDKYNICVFNAENFDVDKLRNFKEKKYIYEEDFSPIKLLDRINKYGN